MGLPVLRRISLCIHAVATTPAESLDVCIALLLQRWQPSRIPGPVGFRITFFEACSAFTARYSLHARQVALSNPYIRGFSDFVTSITAPIATGWSDPCRVGIAPTEDTRLARRTE